MTDPAPQAMSEAEYLLTERQSPYKREYVGGFVYPLHAQAGTSGNHARIASAYELRQVCCPKPMLRAAAFTRPICRFIFPASRFTFTLT